MIGDDEWNSVVLVHLSTEFSYRRFCVQKSLRREGSKCNDYFGFYKFQLANKVWTASRDFIGKRISVSGRPMLQNVADEDVLSRQIHGRKNLR